MPIGCQLIKYINYRVRTYLYLRDYLVVVVILSQNEINLIRYVDISFVQSCGTLNDNNNINI
jgi:hypothetical protein